MTFIRLIQALNDPKNEKEITNRTVALLFNERDFIAVIQFLQLLGLNFEQYGVNFPYKSLQFVII